jgi:hypothetical protein
MRGRSHPASLKPSSTRPFLLVHLAVRTVNVVRF